MINIDRAYKFRIYPNAEQKELIIKTFGCCRYVYNYYLSMRMRMYEETSESFNYYACAKDLTKLKQQEDTKWLGEVDATALQTSLRNLDDAYKNFFRSVKKGEMPGFPKFKSKHHRRESYQCKCVGTNIKVLDNAIQLPKLGKVKCRISKNVEGRILSATVSRTPSGKFFVSICCTDVPVEELPKTGKAVGLDLGIHSFAVSSDGTEFPNHKYLLQSEKKLAKEQRRLSRKTKDSRNRERARIKVAKVHEHITNQRKDMLHKLSTKMIRAYDIICLEDLVPKDMVKDNFFAKHINDVAWGEFVRLLTYKAEMYGKRVIKIDRFFPSSQICSHCQSQWAYTVNLNVREWTCPTCGTKHNRDYNAAINILNEGLRLIT